MSEILINIPDAIQEQIAAKANAQGVSISVYIENLLRVKNFSSVLDSIRWKTTNILKENNILNEDDLNSYLKS